MLYLCRHGHLTEFVGGDRKEFIFCKHCNKLINKSDVYTFARQKGLLYIRNDRRAPAHVIQHREANRRHYAKKRLEKNGLRNL